MAVLSGLGGGRCLEGGLLCALPLPARAHSVLGEGVRQHEFAFVSNVSVRVLLSTAALCTARS
jgi:hypothetical protein